ncbi:ubiquitin carboxyl-terminal hydrolase 26 isoform X2 [Oreochromis niloticus]|uniref:ubiquitin carboxyl-terminal hydrolase 26 isoform X2 n=1 Tax=Oreochromis niloticus TaxID=8128 RepID=UPI00090465F7|nr:ubiquitin carboxyl-terminal hydrolase 26 isoform X2 [Oreochromis niloticus]
MSPETSSGCNQQRTPRSGYLHAEQKTQQRQDGTSWSHSGSTNTWKEEPTVQTQGHRVVKHLGGGKIMENKIQSTDCFRFPNIGNSCCICNSVHPEESPHSTTDPWLTYNDTQVLHTTGSAACEEQQHSAYILFYKRNCPDTLQFHRIIPNNSCRVGWRMKTAERAKETACFQLNICKAEKIFTAITLSPKMFKLLFHRKKSNKQNVAEKEIPSTSQQSIPDASVAATPTNPENVKKKKKKRKWRRFFCCSSQTDSDSEAETTTVKTQKKSRWSLFKFWKRKRQAAPETTGEPDKISDSSTGKECGESSHQVKNTTEKIPADLSWDTLIMELLDQESGWEHVFNSGVCGGKTIENQTETTDCFGFPNIGNTCYMNSCLQSLLNIEEFIRDISRQEVLWSAVPEAQLLRRLTDIRDCHDSTDYGLKDHHLRSFKKAFSSQAPEYTGSAQKDAHEFLTLFLNEVKRLSPHLKRNAALQGQSYTCPVEDHHVFKMENMRTCKGCGHQSSQQEEFTSLSLDLVPEGSVEDMLETYLKEQEIEFRCDCGGTTSELKSSFDTLPRVLILHLKRFGFTQTYEIQKVDDPVRLQRDLVVPSNQGGGCYSLVSIISHYGGTESGHYICNSVHPEESPYSTSDNWLTYNDAQVLHTTGSAACEEQQNSAYILFYKRNF